MCIKQPPGAFSTSNNPVTMSDASTQTPVSWDLLSSIEQKLSSMNEKLNKCPPPPPMTRRRTTSMPMIRKTQDDENDWSIVST